MDGEDKFRIVTVGLILELSLACGERCVELRDVDVKTHTKRTPHPTHTHTLYYTHGYKHTLI